MSPALKRTIRRVLNFFGLSAYSRFPYIRLAFRYRRPRGPARVLGDDFFAPVALQVIDKQPPPTSDLYQLWSKIPQAHKWLHYFPTYESVIAHFQGRAIRMLEIGVYKGGSVRMWREYLPSESVIVGIDIDPSCAAYAKEDENLYIRIGDQSNAEFLRQVVEEFGPFDLILDDGSHVCSHMIASFNHLFLNGLKDSGVYLAEDTHSNFWHDFRDQSYSFIDLSKDLVDLQHAHYFQNQNELHFRQGHDEQKQQISVPRICREIDEIRFEDSLVTIYKRQRTSPPVSVHL